MAGISSMAILAAAKGVAVKFGVEGALKAGATINGYKNAREAANAAGREADFVAGQHERNAGFLEGQADDALARGHLAETGVRRDMRQLAGDQRAAMAAQGIDIESGSPRDVISNDQRMSEIDIGTIHQNAKREAWGFRTQAEDERLQAAFTREAGRNRMGAARSAGLNTLIDGAGELANIYAKAPKVKR